MIYRYTLSETNKRLQYLKEEYGYENVFIISIDVDIDEVDWIKVHLSTEIKNLKNGIEYAIEKEDYETADMIHKIILFKESDDEVLMLPLHRTQGYTSITIKK
jgi:hypothetical protein